MSTSNRPLGLIVEVRQDSGHSDEPCAHQQRSQGDLGGQQFGPPTPGHKSANPPCPFSYRIPRQSQDWPGHSRRPWAIQTFPFARWDEKHRSRKSVRRVALKTMVTPSTGSLVISSEGQNAFVSPQKKCGEPSTPRLCPSSQSAITSARSASSGVDDAVIVCKMPQDAMIRDVEAFFKQGIPEREADSLANVRGGPISPVGQRKGADGRSRKPLHIEVLEQVRGYLISQVLGVFPGFRRIERGAVHAARAAMPAPKWPCPCDQRRRAALRSFSARRG